MAKRPDVFPHPLLLFSLLLLFAGRSAHGRLISTSAAAADEEDQLISDGATRGDAARSDPFLLLRRSAGYSQLLSAEECEQTYGFLPCTTTVVGNLFLVLTYGFLMFKAATYLSTGSEMLLEILGPGIVGGLFLPILGALPDAMLILGRLILISVRFSGFLFCSVVFSLFCFVLLCFVFADIRFFSFFVNWDLE